VVFDEAAGLVRAHIERKFPKACGMCARVFLDLPDYIRNTRHVGQPVSYDAALGDWKPKEPVGTFAIALCRCGSSVAIDSSGMPLLTLWRLMRFARSETRRRGVTVSEFLVDIRSEVERQALAVRGDAGERAPAGEVVRVTICPR
jgi:hypothetical protein